jgi:hypothetical protein
MFGALNEKQEEYLKDINASGQHLLLGRRRVGRASAVAETAAIAHEQVLALAPRNTSDLMA